jgi:hypothetical protein
MNVLIDTLGVPVLCFDRLFNFLSYVSARLVPC